jgi:hypothetical protein
MNVLRYNPNPLTLSITTCGEYGSMSMWVYMVLKTFCYIPFEGNGLRVLWGAMSIKIDLVASYNSWPLDQMIFRHFDVYKFTINITLWSYAYTHNNSFSYMLPTSFVYFSL